jgi:hypothetical protein
MLLKRSSSPETLFQSAVSTVPCKARGAHFESRLNEAQPHRLQFLCAKHKCAAQHHMHAYHMHAYHMLPSRVPLAYTEDRQMLCTLVGRFSRCDVTHQYFSIKRDQNTNSDSLKPSLQLDGSLSQDPTGRLCSVGTTRTKRCCW